MLRAGEEAQGVCVCACARRVDAQTRSAIASTPGISKPDSLVAAKMQEGRAGEKEDPTVCTRESRAARDEMGAGEKKAQDPARHRSEPVRLTADRPLGCGPRGGRREQPPRSRAASAERLATSKGDNKITYASVEREGSVCVDALRAVVGVCVPDLLLRERVALPSAHELPHLVEVHLRAGHARLVGRHSDDGDGRGQVRRHLVERGAHLVVVGVAAQGLLREVHEVWQSQRREGRGRGFHCPNRSRQTNEQIHKRHVEQAA